ncbi:MAG TPA: orotidine-5'-phosphate decarboxylase [Patescibacteria group bacterium]|nr:orotidine-5'-phosphate decarboxylase [Patescibacteria group bacterium]
MTFLDKLNTAIEKNNSLVCVGLDSDFNKLPEHIKHEEYPQFAFNKAIIDATHDLVCAYKPNSAFYEGFGDKGVKELKMTFDYINEKYPELVTILDAKRADIGNTNEGYIKYCYDYLGADSITLQPYLGSEALKPFFAKADKGNILLCRTSNPGAGELQDLQVGDKKLYQFVAKKAANEWNTNKNVLLVVGATYPEELAEIRQITGDMTFLVPGIGAQGGDVKAILNAGLNSQKKGLIINSSRGIIFASQNDDFAEKAREETIKLRDEINIYR